MGRFGPEVRRASTSIRTYVIRLVRHAENVRHVNDAAGRAGLGCGRGKRAKTQTTDEMSEGRVPVDTFIRRRQAKSIDAYGVTRRSI